MSEERARSFEMLNAANVYYCTVRSVEKRKVLVRIALAKAGPATLPARTTALDTGDDVTWYEII